MMNETRRRTEGGFDWSLVAAVYLISGFGLLCIAMARYDPSVSAGMPK